MDNQVSGVIVATRTAFTQITALAVQYSFSILGAIILPDHRLDAGAPDPQLGL